MKLIVGLGNPGKTYIQTRHNIGFIVIDYLLKSYEINLKVDLKLESAYVKTKIEGIDCIIAKPLTFMNLSGNAVYKLARYYQVDFKDILIVVDDTALELGKIRLREKGSHGGQNGLKDIILKLGTQAFKRLRIGIGHQDSMKKKDYVLGKLTKKEIETLMPTFDQAKDAILDWLQNDRFDLVMTTYNTPQTK